MWSQVCICIGGDRWSAAGQHDPSDQAECGRATDSNSAPRPGKLCMPQDV